MNNRSYSSDTKQNSIEETLDRENENQKTISFDKSQSFFTICLFKFSYCHLIFNVTLSINFKEAKGAQARSQIIILIINITTHKKKWI